MRHKPDHRRRRWCSIVIRLARQGLVQLLLRRLSIFAAAVRAHWAVHRPVDRAPGRRQRSLHWAPVAGISQHFSHQSRCLQEMSVPMPLPKLSNVVENAELRSVATQAFNHHLKLIPVDDPRQTRPEDDAKRVPMQAAVHDVVADCNFLQAVCVPGAIWRSMDIDAPDAHLRVRRRLVERGVRHHGPRHPKILHNFQRNDPRRRKRDELQRLSANSILWSQPRPQDGQPPQFRSAPDAHLGLLVHFLGAHQVAAMTCSLLTGASPVCLAELRQGRCNPEHARVPLPCSTEDMQPGAQKISTEGHCTLLIAPEGSAPLASWAARLPTSPRP
mmetsp:Transcript_59853/g.129716  ORF Transcript_59853/g.129716 Transcript_59853/m.129716 type:complete len:330 (-) Transcript_59853:1511-2500(-)